MVTRLSPRDAMYYFLDDSRSTTHLGALLIVDPAAAQASDDPLAMLEAELGAVTERWG